MTDKAQTGWLGITKFAVGIVVVALFVWTPRTGRGILAYAVLLLLLIAAAFALSQRESTGYWPDKPDND
jgi:ABC-type xylose transport system permease subunit